MKRVCIFTPSADGGHALYTQELLTAMVAVARDDCRFELITSEDLAPQFDNQPYTIHKVLPPLAHRQSFATPLHWAVSRVTHYARRDWSLLKWLKGQPDVVAVHIQEWTPWLAAPLIRRIRAMGKRVYYTVHNIVPHKFPRLAPKSAMIHWIRSACRECDVLFVHTDRLADDLSRFLGAGHPPIQVIPHGVWTVKEHAAPLPLTDRLNWKKLLCFGAIRENKGTDLILDAMAGLPGYSLTIAGYPYHMDYFKAEIVPRVKKLRDAGIAVDLRDRFIPDEEVAELFATHSAIVLPYTKGFVAQSGVAFMALAYSLPLIASEVGGLRDLLAEFKIGTTFSEATVEALCGAIRSLHDCSVEELTEQIEAAKSRYSWAEAARRTISGYARARDSEQELEMNDCTAATTAAR